ncbi:hypothetical protein [Tellurirhabdus rosea]|uniref:hypothetical protein n=1 Tax=Tellurirhabdus rosea TaxID=2674997 RepID=UPI00225C0DFA|nr:hypothetical protein [Tellurirhabdus rosea]
MKVVFSLVLLLGISGAAAGQGTEQTQRRLQRKETRTTTPELYKERDTLVSMLKQRMTALTDAGGPLGGYFGEEAKITGPSGQEQSPADYQKQQAGLKVREYRLRNLRIEEATATATETYVYTEPGSAGKPNADKKATVNTDLRKGSDGRWFITRMRISSN